MRNPVTIFTATPGLNNLVASVRLKFDPEKGTRELAEAVDSEIDRSGRPRRRLGQTIVVDDVFHSGYCAGGDAYVVQDRTNDAAIYQVATDDSLTGIASGLTKGYRVSFWQVGERTYWMNGAQTGMLYAGGSYAWPTVATHVGVVASAEYYPAPLGTHICVFRGRMCVVVGDTVYASEPYSYGEFRMSSCYWRFPSAVTMIKPTAGGLWVSDSDQIGFIQAADKFEAMTWVKKATVPAHEWSECIMLADLSRTVFQVPGMSALWSSDEGLCIGTEDGRFIVATADKLVYPTGGSAATVMFGDMVINSVGHTTISESQVELIEGGAFDDLTAWVVQGDPSVSSGQLLLDRSALVIDVVDQNITVTSGKVYSISIDVVDRGNNLVVVRVSTSQAGSDLLSVELVVGASQSFTFKPVSNSVWVRIYPKGTTTSSQIIDNVSCKLSSNLVVNGEFSRDALWTKGTGFAYSAGKMVATAGVASSLSPTTPIPVVAGTRYVVTHTLTVTGGTITPTVGGVTLATRSASGTYRALITALTTANLSFDKDASFAGSVDDVSVVPYDEYDGTLPITT